MLFRGNPVRTLSAIHPFPLSVGQRGINALPMEAGSKMMRIQKKCGKKSGLRPLGGSYLPQISRVDPIDHSKVINERGGYPDGYIGWRAFCRKHGKCDTGGGDYTAYKKLKADGTAEVFMNERIVKENAEWPHGLSSRTWQPKRSKA